MKRKLLSFLLIIGLMLSFLPVWTMEVGPFSGSDPVYGESPSPGGQSVTILFTHDMHSHLLPVKGVGGFAALKTAIDEERAKDADAILVDAGDFSMGTLFQTLYSEAAPELRLFGMMGYDAVTFGNHEFDYRAQGLAAMLQAARESGDPLPAITASNLDWPENPDEAVATLEQAMEDYGVSEYLMLNKGGLKIAVFGLLGYDAIESAPMSGIGFTDFQEQAKIIVDRIREQENPDLILCLSHSGTWEDKEISEDELLAEAVPEIDVIISGHTHSYLSEPLVIGSTLIVSAGEYSKNLGKLKLSRLPEGTWTVEEYKNKPIDTKLAQDAKMGEKVQEFKNMVDKGYLSPYHLSYDQVIARSPFDFTPFIDFSKEQKEDTLGNLIADSYIYAVRQAEGANYEPIAAAVVPAGVVRQSIEKGDITTADVFAVSSLGIGRDGTVGYPLISVYLTGKELRGIAEVDASITPIMSSAQLYVSGLSYTFNPNRLPFNKVTSVELMLPDGTYSEIEDETLYRVVCGLYSGQMLGAVKGKTMGLIALDPKDKDGNLITDFEEQILRNNEGELKEWLALASYLRSFPPDPSDAPASSGSQDPSDASGIPLIPMAYNETQGRKIVEDSTGIGDLLAKPNHVFFLIVGAVIALLLLLVLLWILIRHLVLKRKKRAI